MTETTAMRVGVGLPTTLPGVDGPMVLGWARRAEALGFSSLGVIDRLVYDSFEPLAALCAAGAVTHRVELLTTVLLGPLRANAALLAKEAASIDRLTSGRLTLGMAPGVRADDFAAGGVDYQRRGALLDELVTTMRRLWADGSTVGPRPVRAGGPRLLFGGMSAATFRRVAQLDAGWVSGVVGIDAFAAGAARACQAWSAAGRPGRPRLVACATYAIGVAAANAMESSVRDYYAFLPWLASAALASAVRSPCEVRTLAERFAAAGCTDLVLFPGAADLSQLDALADALQMGAAERTMASSSVIRCR